MTSLLQCGRGGLSLDDLEIVDMHGHLGRFFYCIPDLSAEGLVEVMDRVGVRSILVSHIQCLSTGTADGNREVLEAMRAFPGRILGYVGLWPCDAETVRREIERCLADGFVGIKLHSANGFAYTAPAYKPALKVANERRLPVLLHFWGSREEFADVRRLSDEYPEVSFLLAHSGVAEIDDYVDIARTQPNVYLELSLSASPRGLVERLVAGAGVDKVVWGSDAIVLSMTHQIGKVLGARLCDEEKRAILSTNARNILGRVLTGDAGAGT